MSVTDVLGWVGALGILGAYGLLTVGRWDSASLRYQGANTLFAVLLLVWAVSIAAWQSALLNGVWAAVGLVGVVRIVGRRGETAPEPHVGD
ncbi:MAG: hypothetical protein LCI03_11690 [Actinobacteria bacterium]|nr:hypothetical protein [Actinomycetota bacterium]